MALKDIPISDELSPAQWYALAENEVDFVADPVQRQTVQRLDQLWHRLVDFKTRRNQFLGRSLFSPEVPKGLYLWGGVGRGKTMLMDVFYGCVPYRRKRRIHFHGFISEIQQRLKVYSGSEDPLLQIAARVAKETRLLCLDEFHVDDIADAMILARLLDAMFEQGVILVTTSNYAPDELYPNGLQRQRFLPAIALLKHRLQVINLDGEVDYRMRALTLESGLLVTRDRQQAEARMAQWFARLAAGMRQQTEALILQGRQLPVNAVARTVIWLDFDELCGGAHAQQDYLELARRFDMVLLSWVPQMSAEQAAEARRFTWLIDVLYDHRVKLLLATAVELDRLYTQGLMAGEFSRTVSRLVEMQSPTWAKLSLD